MEYWYPYDTKNRKALTWEQYREELSYGRKDTEFRLSTRYTALFNARDVEGMPLWQRPEVGDISADELIEKLSEGMRVPVFTDGGNRAYYSPAQDQIHLPTLAHATGRPSRLSREQGGGFGSAAYAYEELVAEMCSCFVGVNLTAEATPAHIDNHKAYVQAWVQSIREKPKTLVKAIRDAQAAASFMDWKAGLMTDKGYEKPAALRWRSTRRAGKESDKSRQPSEHKQATVVHKREEFK